MKSTEILIRPIPAIELDRVRATGLDVSGSPVVTLEMPGQPLRCCLRNAQPGERLILFGYAPTLPSPFSPYREVGAVFAHADPCDAAPVWNMHPPEWLGRSQVLRAYDSRGWIHPATTIHDGSDPVTALGAVLAAPGVVEVHSRNVTYGCFMFVATAAARRGAPQA
jgi:hypothetical protein